MKLIIVLLLTLSAAIIPTVLSAQGTSGVSARINAQPLDDGRIEFAMQVANQATGQWGDRIRPRVRFFPPEPNINSWYSSSPPAQIGEVETRIRVRRLPDGRTEFALQQKEDGANWGEIIAPSGRYLSSAHRTSHIGRWLSSTEVLLATSIVAPVVVAPEGVPVLIEDDAVIVDRPHLRASASDPAEYYFYGTVRDLFTDRVGTVVSIATKAMHDDHKTAVLVYRCHQAGTLDAYITNAEDRRFVPDGDRVHVTWRIDGGEVVTEHWYSQTTDGSMVWVSQQFQDHLPFADSAAVRFTLQDDSRVTFTLEEIQDIFTTPVQPNLDYCGHY